MRSTTWILCATAVTLCGCTTSEPDNSAWSTYGTGVRYTGKSEERRGVRHMSDDELEEALRKQRESDRQKQGEVRRFVPPTTAKPAE